MSHLWAIGRILDLMKAPAYIERARSRLRRPIQVREVPHLEQVARELRTLRQAAGLTRPQLAALSDTSAATIKDVELTRARTRRTTLDRLARALSAARPQLGSPRKLLRRLEEAAGPALAPESRYAHQVNARRERWARKGRFGEKPGPSFEWPRAGETARQFERRIASRGPRWCVCPHCGSVGIGPRGSG